MPTTRPKHLADKILQSKSALEGERKQVTVLFADIQGSMELATQLDPEQWHALLEFYFAILANAVHRFEGTVNHIYHGELHELRAQLAAREGLYTERVAALAVAHDCYTRFGMTGQAARITAVSVD